jgi:RNA polymerase sigma-70 factor (ECF subfamily)
MPAPTAADLQPQLQLLQTFIAALPELDRLIITLELEEVKQAEIAEILGLEAGQVRVRIHRIKQKLAQKFNDYAKQHGL